MNREFDTLFSRSVHPASHVKLTPTCPLDNLLSARQLQSSKLASAHIQSLRIRRRHTPPRLLIISLPHAVVSSCQLFCGKLRTEPATKQLDESFAPLPRSDKRFARQHCIRTSTKVSPGFLRPRKSSLSFGSQRMCSTSDPFLMIRTEPCCTNDDLRRGSQASLSLCVVWFQSP
jgi:hypothetical protein